jgi:mono/diheme cytochrome c family protein
MRLLALVAGSLLALGIAGCDKREDSLPTSEPQTAPNWTEQQGFQDNEEAVRGAQIFAQVGCLQCHTYLGEGITNMGAPDLTDIGRTGRSAQWYARYIRDPSQFGNQVMPRFADLGERNLLALGAFLQASKGER